MSVVRQIGTTLSSPPLEGCPTGGVVRDTVNYKTLPFNPDLKERARELRKSGSLPEALLWKEINGKKLNGLDFDRQKVVEYAKMRNPEIEILFVSAKTGEGIDKLAAWILNQIKEWNQ